MRARVMWGVLAVAAIGVALLALFDVATHPVRQVIDSPDAARTARLVDNWLESGLAPYGSEITIANGSNPLGRFTGERYWIGYCARGRLSWRSATELELFCPKHPDGKDVFVAPGDGPVKFRVVRE